MQQVQRIFLGTAMLLMFLAGAAAAETLYVQSVKAMLMATPSLGGERVAVVERGASLAVLETAKGWYRVESAGQSGWISRLLVSEQPPLAQVSVLASSDEELDKSARRRASTFTTAAAARGLADRARVSQQYRADYEGVRLMESLEIDKEEALAFIAGEAGK